MRYLIGFLLFPAILATAPVVSAASPEHAEGHAPERTAALHRGIRRSSAEVARLRRDVAEQESRSRAAAARLSEQDRALEQLRRQLQAAEAGKAAPAAGP